MKTEKNITKEAIYSKLQEIANKLDKVDSDYRREVTSIKEEVAALTELITDLSVEDQVEEVTRPVLRETEQNPNKPLELGDVVEITNTRNGLQGTIGTLSKLNTYWAWVQGPDPTIKPIQRARFNVSVVEKPNNHGYHQDDRDRWIYTGYGKATKRE